MQYNVLIRDRFGNQIPTSIQSLPGAHLLQMNPQRTDFHLYQADRAICATGNGSCSIEAVFDVLARNPAPGSAGQIGPEGPVIGMQLYLRPLLLMFAAARRKRRRTHKRIVPLRKIILSASTKRGGFYGGVNQGLG